MSRFDKKSFIEKPFREQDFARNSASEEVGTSCKLKNVQ